MLSVNFAVSYSHQPYKIADIKSPLELEGRTFANLHVVLGTALEDIQEADEDSVKLLLDSRPSSRQVTFRPLSARSRPLSGRSRPGSAKSRSTIDSEQINGKKQLNKAFMSPRKRSGLTQFQK